MAVQIEIIELKVIPKRIYKYLHFDLLKIAYVIIYSVLFICKQLILHFLDKIIYYILKSISNIFIIIIVICNYKKFKTISKLFINSYSFGHSIIETTAFFYVHGDNGLCISVGNRRNRNKYFKDLYSPNALIHFWLPHVKTIKFYHALRLRVHKIIDNYLKNSLLIKIIIKKNLHNIDRNTVLDEAVSKLLIEKYSFTGEKVQKIINQLKAEYMEVNNKHSSSLQFLVQHKNLIEFYLTNRIKKSNRVFLEQLGLFNLTQTGERLKLCTLILRKSEKLWSGMGFHGYLDVIKYLSEQKYIVNLIGDTDDWRKVRIEHALKNVFDHTDYDLKESLFQVLTIMNSDFCLGDQSGAQVMNHFFGKKNLIINVIPIGQLQYNSMILPQIWKLDSGTVASKSVHFDQNFNRYKPFIKDNGERFSPKFQEPEYILKAVQHFKDLAEDSSFLLRYTDQHIGNEHLISKFVENSSISPIFFEILNSRQLD